ncbi:MAG TPA: 16S rRNA (guanine(966)-N(2))-methyltransferase RsmD [Candidatus Dormibacteraeota bacterium]|nr:16S rRNA (guanine(966)-N(2))-methyltransferase RsmD [Candidatus Dormibacteraeota bacterium]
MAAPRASGSAGRVIAGSAKGRALVSPGEGTRPLGDRVKQTLFAILEPTIRGRAFLDVFAGSGAAGIEALSRGAASVVFVERDAGAVAAIQRNLAATGLAGPQARVDRSQAGSWFNALARGDGRPAGPFAAILIDPPYDLPELLEAALESIAGAGPGTILEPDGIAVAKHFWKTPPPARIGLLRSARERRFGETTLTFLRWADAEEGEEDR